MFRRVKLDILTTKRHLLVVSKRSHVSFSTNFIGLTTRAPKGLHGLPGSVPLCFKLPKVFLVESQLRNFSSNATAPDDIFAPTDSDSSNLSALALTDPLQIYEAKVASGELFRDEAQHRAAIELQHLSHRLIDYKPPVNFRQRIRELSKFLEESEIKQAQEAAEHPEIEQRAWYVPDAESTKLVKQLSDEDELLNFDSPQGLLLHGEVGCGKSMLMDLFADSLPHVSKRRVHYNNFMLSLYAHIHQISEQRRNSLRTGSKLTLDNDFILLQLAERMVDKSTVLLLDEFMLPDIAAAKIVQTLFTFFFKLGGVLVATSNRLPEDLYSTDFKKAQFTKFFRILQARCVSHDMRSDNDWRSILSNPEKTKELLIKQRSETEAEAEEEAEIITGSSAISKVLNNKDEFPDIEYYHQLPNTNDPEEVKRVNDKWAFAVQEICEDLNTPRPSHIVVYGHKVDIPWSKDGVAYFDFNDICGKYLAAADYISLVSRYHTFVIDNVPALKISQKNEARRFIVFLDAMYEAKCRMLIRAEVPPEDLFFADIRDKINAMESEEGAVADQVTFSAVHQDLSQPFRPNVSSYENNQRDQEDSAKNEDPQTNSHGHSDEQAHSDSISNNSSGSILSAINPLRKLFSFKRRSKSETEVGGSPNFINTSAFTGEDERFAYKRAVSRLREMTGSPRWVQTVRWAPLDNGSRPWETFDETKPHPDSYFLGCMATGSGTPKMEPKTGNPGLSDSVENGPTVPESNLKDSTGGYTSPFRKNRNPAPKFDAHHFWAMVEWGPGKRIKDANARGWIRSNNAYTAKKD